MTARPPARPAGNYVRRPLAVRAIQYTGDNLAEVVSFHGDHFSLIESPSCRMALTLTAHEGELIADCGYWVLRDMRGTFTVLSPQAFEEDYTLKGAQPA